MRLKISKKWISVISVLLAIILIVGFAFFLFGNSGTQVNRDKSRIGKIVKTTKTPVSESMQIVAENEQYRLFFNGANCQFGVEVKQTGKIWYSNPQDSDPYKKNVNKANINKANSQLVIHYYNSISEDKEMDSQTYAINAKQYTAKKIKNGVEVTYSFAYPESDDIYPKVMTKTRFNELLGQLTFSADQKLMKKLYSPMSKTGLSKDDYDKLTEKYPILTEQDIYVLREGQMNVSNKKNLAKVFTKLNYTKQDVKNDHAECKYSGSTGDGESYTIPVRYTLETDGFRAEIDGKNIRYTEADTGFYPLVSIELLNYFGCTNSSENGYFLLPDGSGSLIDLQSDSKNTNFDGYVYGKDKSILSLNKTSYNENITMPVYGVKAGNEALFAVVDEGDAMARIRMEKAGDGIPYNRINTSFDVMNMDYIPIGDVATRENYYVYSNDIFSGKMAVKYYFLSGEKANYSEMAKQYRTHLINEGSLPKQTQSTDATMLLEFQGAVDAIQTVAGVPVRTVLPLTTFSQMQEIVSQLQKQGVGKLSVTCSGYYQGGYRTGLQNKLNPESKLGGMEGFQALASYLQNQGIAFYPGVDLQNVAKDSLFDSFSSKTHAVRNMTREIFQLNQKYLLSPYYLSEMTGSFYQDLAGKKINGISLINWGKSLYSDFNAERPVLRQDSLKALLKSASQIKDAGGELLFDGPNAYVLGYASQISNVPFGDSGYRVTDASVPFYQMVVHGYKSYAGTPINYEGEAETAMLQSLATGSMLNFKMMAEPGYTLKETDYSDMYASGYTEWKDEILSMYRRTSDTLAKISDKALTDYSVPEEKLSVSVFENTTIVINYSNSDKSYNGKKVPARDFLVIE